MPCFRCCAAWIEGGTSETQQCSFSALASVLRSPEVMSLRIGAVRPQASRGEVDQSTSEPIALDFAPPIDDGLDDAATHPDSISAWIWRATALAKVAVMPLRL
jgi:hypothetical protein